MPWKNCLVSSLIWPQEPICGVVFATSGFSVSRERVYTAA